MRFRPPIIDEPFRDNLPISALLLCLVLATIARGNDEPPKERDAFFWNSLIGQGINLGNALDAPKEGRWGVRLEQGHFDLIARAGFESVRIPVRWSAHADSAPPYAIDKAFLARVDWAIEQALSRKLVAIVNIHHYEQIAVSPSDHKQRFLALWKQIAEHYRTYPGTLYFEILNEPSGKLTSDLWNTYAAEAIRLIRTSNPRRAIVVGPAQWNNISQLGKLILPRDDKNLIVTFHYYQPFRFTHQGAAWVGQHTKAWLGTPWRGTDEEQQTITADLDEAVRWSKANRRPLFLGEFGAFGRADLPSRARWTSFVRSEAEKRSISWAYWEFCSGFGAYDQDRKQWVVPLLTSLIPESRAILPTKTGSGS